MVKRKIIESHTEGYLPSELMKKKLNITEALCVAWLLQSASFGESRIAENVRRIRKRMVDSKSPRRIAQELEQKARKAAGKILSKGQHFAYIYIQPFEANDSIFDDKEVKEALTMEKGFQTNEYVWPQSPENTNFRIAFLDYGKQNEGNNASALSEYQLFINDGLGKMIPNFDERHKGCPNYVILYSTFFPCMAPPYPDESTVRCAKMTIRARIELRTICPAAAFYFYTHQVNDERYKELFKRIIEFMTDTGISLITH